MLFDFLTRKWFLSKQEMVFGPFTYQEIIQMLHVETVCEQDLIRQGEEGEWKKVVDQPLFSQEALDELINFEGFDFDEHILKELYVRRANHRTQIELPVLLIDGAKIIKAQMVQLGAGGARLKLDASSDPMQVGQELRVHVKKNQIGVFPFNVRGRIVNVSDGFVSVEFLDTSEDLKTHINEFAVKRAG